MNFVLGLEAIGMRHTAAVISDDTGRILAGRRTTAEPLAFQTAPRDLFRSRLNQLIVGVVKDAGLSGADLDRTTACIGIGGLNSKYDAVVDLPREFESLSVRFGRIICTGEAEIVLASHSQSQVGSGIVCGLGSTAFLGTQRRFYRIGGWGPAIGDDGSGYWMGRAVARAIGEESDLGEPPSILWQEVCKWLEGMRTAFMEEVPEWIEGALEWQHYVQEHCALLGDAARDGCDPDYRSAMFGFAHRLYRGDLWRSVASGFVKPLMSAWELGDARASRIVKQAANDLANLHFLASRNDPTSQIEPLILYGGVTTHNKRFREFLIETIAKLQQRQVYPVGPWTPTTMRPVVGALLYALGTFTGGSLQMPPEPIINNLRESYFAVSVDFNIQND